jgi:chromosome segregation ATPase
MATPKSVLIDIDIRAEDIKAAQAAMANAQKAAALYTAEIARVKKEQAEANKALNEGTISVEDYSEAQVSLTTAQKAATKGLQESNKEYQNNKTVVDAAKGSNDQLRAQLSLMTK